MKIKIIIHRKQMNLPTLHKGKLLKRYKRFLADIRLENDEIITAHVPNSGAMTSCIEEGCTVFVSYHDNPKRKLKYTLELTKMGDTLICTNTSVANHLGYEAIKEKAIKELLGYTDIKKEQKYGKNSRIDILLENDKEKCYVEIKSVTLNVAGMAAFPDAVTTRGQKHLDELIEMKKQNHRAVMLFIVLREDIEEFRIAHEIDSLYHKKIQAAKRQGVDILCYQASLCLEKITLKRNLSLILD